MMLLNLLRHISRKFEHRVISLSTIGYVGQLIGGLGIDVEALGMGRRRPSPLALLRLVRRLRTIKPSIVHTWLYHADLMGGVAALLARVKFIIWNICSSQLPKAQTKLSTRIVLRVLALLSRLIPDKILTVSRAGIDAHVALGYVPDRFLFVPVGIELRDLLSHRDARHAIRIKLGIPYDATLIGLIARFDPLKNQEGFLSAAGILHKKRPEVHFVLAGPGVDRNNRLLMEWVNELGLTDVVHLLGFQEEIIELTSAIDIAVSSSRSEGFSTTICEAMMCGVPCVVTDVGDSAYIVGNAGRVVPPNDAQAMSDAWEDLLRLSKDEFRFMGKSAWQRASEHFGINLMVRSYEAVYDQLMRVGDNSPVQS